MAATDGRRSRGAATWRLYRLTIRKDTRPTAGGNKRENEWKASTEQKEERPQESRQHLLHQLNLAMLGARACLLAILPERLSQARVEPSQHAWDPREAGARFRPAASGAPAGRFRRAGHERHQADHQLEAQSVPRLPAARQPRVLEFTSPDAARGLKVERTLEHHSAQTGRPERSLAAALLAELRIPRVVPAS